MACTSIKTSLGPLALRSSDLEPEQVDRIAAHDARALGVAPACDACDGVEVLVDALPAVALALERREERVVGACERGERARRSSACDRESENLREGEERRAHRT